MYRDPAAIREGLAPGPAGGIVVIESHRLLQGVGDARQVPLRVVGQRLDPVPLGDRLQATVGIVGELNGVLAGVWTPVTWPLASRVVMLLVRPSGVRLVIVRAAAS